MPNRVRMDNPVARRLFGLLRNAGRETLSMERLTVECRAPASKIRRALNELEASGLIRTYEEDD